MAVQIRCCGSVDDSDAAGQRTIRDTKKLEQDPAAGLRTQPPLELEDPLSGRRLTAFCAYCRKRHESLDACLAFYADLGHRKRRWKTTINEQSEAHLYERLEGLRKRSDDRPLALAYGSCGMVASRPGAACYRGSPPCISVGMMCKLSRRFVGSPIPEAYTSKTRCHCLGSCGTWAENEEEMGKKIRGVRRCTQRDCMLPLNRNRNGATNIGTNFMRLFDDWTPIRSMSEDA
jgi:hypothetical protein